MNVVSRYTLPLRKELCRISLAQLQPTTSWCKSREDSGNVGRISVCIGSINERESSLFASYRAFCTSWREVIVLIECDKNLDLKTTLRDVNAEFERIGLLSIDVNFINEHKQRQYGNESMAFEFL